MNDELNYVYSKFTMFKEKFDKDSHFYEDLIMTGIPAIDDPLDGICKTDLIVIGAPTGSGKSQIASIISKNIAHTKKVLFFALEAYDGEFEDRIKYNCLIQEIYKLQDQTINYPSFKQWKYHKWEDKRIDECEILAIDNFSKTVKNNICYRYTGIADYTIELFTKELLAAIQYKTADIIIIDHLHFFSFDSAESENRAQKRIINKIRDISLHIGIPIILIAHLRKKDRGNKALVPTIEEFHGSSEIVKNPTVVITLGPAYDIEMKENYIYPTYFYIPKDRFNGGITRYLMACNYNQHLGEYEKEYKLFTISKNAEDKQLIEKSKLPKWAIHACNKGEYETRYKNK